MDSSSGTPLFMPLLCPNRTREHFERKFTPTAHDLVVLNPEGVPQIATNASVGQIISILNDSNCKCAAVDDEEADDSTPLAVIRFDEDGPDDETPLESTDDWSQLWPYLDPCCNTSGNSIDIVTTLRQADSHCHSSMSENTISYGLHEIECSKLFYSLAFSDKRILLAHHFHMNKKTGKVKEMVRMVACGISREKLEKMLCKAILFVGKGPSESNNRSPDIFVSSSPALHPVAIMCGMLQCLEEWCGDEVEMHQRRVLRIDSDIIEERNKGINRPKGSEINHMQLRLSEASFRLGEVLKKLQCLLCSVAHLKDMRGLPNVYEQVHDARAAENAAFATPECHLVQKWRRQLGRVHAKLSVLKSRAQQHKINIENLQERIKGMLITVSILIQEKEKDWNREATIKQQQTAEYQLSMIEYQVKMLKAQELIARRTKRDNSVMKVIAVLTSLFLPGAFMATLFSAPIFKWDEEDPMGPHFMTYWYFTVPLTAILVIGFSVWFLKMWYDDRQEEKRQAKEHLQDNLERSSDARQSETSSV